MNDRSRTLAALAAILLAGPARAEEPPCPHCHGAKQAAQAEAAPAVAEGAKVQLADLTLVDQDGAAVNLRQALAGEPIVVVSFIYTTCTTICPVLSGIMGQVQERLGARAGKDVRLVTVSIDPARDTPERLKAYAARFKAGAGWTWLTGEPGEVERALRGMGAYSANIAEHGAVVLVGDGRAGTWTRFNGFPSPEKVVERVDELARARAAAAAAATEGREAKARAYFTDTALVDQDGEPRRFYDEVLRDRTVLMSFVFTTCLDACPLIVKKLNAVRAELGERFGREVRFVSLSVDPEQDTPAALREFARKQGALHEGWTFLTGEKGDVKTVLGRLGQFVEDPSDHFTGFIAANVRTGHWTKVRPDMPAAAVADLMRRLADEQAPAPATATAPTARAGPAEARRDP